MRDEEGVFGEYDDESRMVCSRNYGIVAEYGLLKHFLGGETFDSKPRWHSLALFRDARHSKVNK